MTALVHDDYIVGENKVTTNTGTFATAQTIVKRTVIARVKASGEIKPWAPAANDGTEKAIGITVFDIDTTSGAAEQPFHDGGCFNVDSVQFGSATAIQKSACFDGTPISTQKLG